MKHLEATQGLICHFTHVHWSSGSGRGSFLLLVAQCGTCFDLGLSVYLAGHSAFWMHLFVYILYPRKESGILVVAIMSPLC